jgi:hypothetical protein
MAVPDAVLLLAMGRAHARIHVEHNATGRTSTVHKIDPLAEQVGKSRKVLGCREPLRLEAAHLARRRGRPLSRFTADDPTHRRIITQALGVVQWAQILLGIVASLFVVMAAARVRPPRSGELKGAEVLTVAAGVIVVW